jgi:hypothetical protein
LCTYPQRVAKVGTKEIDLQGAWTNLINKLGN